MKKLFRKAITVLGSVALVGATVATAAAASYPSPFTSNTAVVYSGNPLAAATDYSAATEIVANLNTNVAVPTSGTGSTITGETASLASGSDLLYMNDELNENIQILTKDNFPTVLADGTFTDDDGTDYDFEQTLVIGDHTSNRFAFSDSDNELDDPTVLLELSSSTTNAIYNLTATFNSAVNLSASGSEGEDITLFGKTYTIGTATDVDTLVLLGGAGSAIVNVGATQSIPVNGIPYDVVLNGLSSASTTQASISVNGDTKTFTQGQTKTVGGVDVFVKTVFRTGDTGEGYAEIQLGADKLTFEDGQAVKVGSDNDDIEGTLVTIVGDTAADEIGTLTKITVGVVAKDNDVNHVLVGESFVDPVFGSVVLKFNGVENGPTFVGEKDTGRTELEIRKSGSRELEVSLTDNAGNSETLPFVYNDALSDDSSNTIHVVEGESLADDSYFILNSGNNQHFMQITNLNLNQGSNSDVEMKDLLSDVPYKFENHNFGSGYSATIAGQTYTITNDSSTTITVVSSDYGKAGVTGAKTISVYPYLELVSGEDTRVAWTDNITINLVNTGTIFTTPTGDITLASNSSVDTESPGEVDYVVAVTEHNATYANVTIALDVNQDGTSDNANTNVSLLFVEDDDKSESTTTTKNAVIMEVDDGGTYATCSTPLFPQQTEDTGYSSETWNDNKWTGWLTNYGTYVWRDISDSDQALTGLSYGDDMMYADIIFAEGESSDAGTVSTGVKIYRDSEKSSFASMNLIVVGGSAINTIAAELLGAAYSEGAFTTATDVGAGEFMIGSFARNGKTALLVAGYNAADTEKGVTYLLNKDVVTTTGTKYIGTSATSAELVTVTQ